MLVCQQKLSEKMHKNNEHFLCILYIDRCAHNVYNIIKRKAVQKVVTFGQRMKELRQRSNLSQQGLSKIIGVSKSSINMYERGEREPSIDTIKAIADFFDVQTDYLLGKHDDSRSVKRGTKYNKAILDRLRRFQNQYGLDESEVESVIDWAGAFESLQKNLVYTDEAFSLTIERAIDSYKLDKELPNKNEKPADISDELWNVILNDPKTVALFEMMVRWDNDKMNKIMKIMEEI